MANGYKRSQGKHNQILDRLKARKQSDQKASVE